jgi:transposase-like protein
MAYRRDVHESEKVWMYLSRAVDSQGNTLEFLLSATRNALVIKRFFAKTLAVPHISTPRVITVVKWSLSKGFQGAKSERDHARSL